MYSGVFLYNSIVHQKILYNFWAKDLIHNLLHGNSCLVPSTYWVLNKWSMCMTGEWRGCRNFRMVSQTRSGKVYSKKPKGPLRRRDFVWNTQMALECEACGKVVDEHAQLKYCRLCRDKVCKDCRKKVRVPAVRYRLGVVIDRETGEREEIPVQTYAWDYQCNRFHHYPEKVKPIVLGTHERP